jgi:hypothetical protein
MAAAARIGFAIIAFATSLAGYHVVGSIAQNYEKTYYRRAIQNLVEMESGEKRKDYADMLSGYIKASSADGIHQFYGSSFLHGATEKLKDKYGKPAVADPLPEASAAAVAPSR